VYILPLTESKEENSNARRNAVSLKFGVYSYLGAMMASTMQEVASLLERLPEDCSLEDIQYHLWVTQKVRNGLERADSEGAVEQDEAEARLAKWIID
jgi:hypothetical protein